MFKKFKKITLSNSKIVLFQLISKKNSRYIRKYILPILIIVFILFFPIVLEFLIVHNNITSSFNNSEWFAFWGGYIGSIITIVTIYITIKIENRKTKLEIAKQYENSMIEKEMERATKVKSVILLDKYNFDFNNTRDLINEYRNFSRDFFDIETDLKKLEWVNENTTNKNEFYKELGLLATYERLSLLERTYNLEVDFITGVKKDVKEMIKQSNDDRHKLNDLYDIYINEMMKKMYSLQ